MTRDEIIKMAREAGFQEYLLRVYRADEGIERLARAAYAAGAEAECEALRADAERYRWLRSDVATAENYPIACMRDGGWLLLGDELDAAIDAAREWK